MKVWTRENTKQCSKIVDDYNNNKIGEDTAIRLVQECIPNTKQDIIKSASKMKQYLSGNGEKSTFKGHSKNQMLGTLDYVLETYGKKRALLVLENYLNNKHPSNVKRNQALNDWLLSNVQ